jgi:hypothetical protein
MQLEKQVVQDLVLVVVLRKTRRSVRDENEEALFRVVVHFSFLDD